MRIYLARRLGQSLLVLLGVSFIVFFILYICLCLCAEKRRI